jgi:hypothetical protein
MVNGMMREKPGTSMLAIAPDQNKFTRIFMREINEPYGKVFLKFFGLTHEHPEFMFLSADLRVISFRFILPSSFISRRGGSTTSLRQAIRLAMSCSVDISMSHIMQRHA